MEFRKILCPFCKASEVEAEITPEEVKRSTARAGGRTSTMTWTVPEKTVAISDCSACGKSKTEINKVLRGEKSTMSADDRKRRFEELQKLRDEISRRKEAQG